MTPISIIITNKTWSLWLYYVVQAALLVLTPLFCMLPSHCFKASPSLITIVDEANNHKYVCVAKNAWPHRISDGETNTSNCLSMTCKTRANNSERNVNYSLFDKHSSQILVLGHLGLTLPSLLSSQWHDQIRTISIARSDLHIEC